MKKQNKLVAIYLFLLVIFIGCCIAAYPYIAREINKERNSNIIDRYNVQVEQMSKPDIGALYHTLKDYNDQIVAGTAKGYSELPSIEGILGIIKIPELECTLPIYYGTSDEVLSQGAGHLLGSSIPLDGESVLSVVSAHSGLPSLYAFDYIDSLKEGDEIDIEILDTIYQYRVTDMVTVLPEQAEKYLKLKEGENNLVLLTCTPYGINSHRLLVFAEFVCSVSGSIELTTYLLWILLILIIILCLIIIALKSRKRRKINGQRIKT